MKVLILCFITLISHGDIILNESVLIYNNHSQNTIESDFTLRFRAAYNQETDYFNLSNYRNFIFSNGYLTETDNVPLGSSPNRNLKLASFGQSFDTSISISNPANDFNSTYIGYGDIFIIFYFGGDTSFNSALGYGWVGLNITENNEVTLTSSPSSAYATNNETLVVGIIPEPTTVALIGLSTMGLTLYRRKDKIFSKFDAVDLINYKPESTISTKWKYR